MGNCLVTKLKEVVDNDNLPVFGKMEVTIKKFWDGTRMKTITGEEIIEVIGDESPFKNDARTGYINTNGMWPMKSIPSGGLNGDFKLRFTKYNLKAFTPEQADYNLTDFAYTELESINVSTEPQDAPFTIAELKRILPNLLSIELPRGIVGSIREAASAYPEATKIVLGGISGSFEDYGLYNSVVNYENATIVNISNITKGGSIEGFVANKRGIGKTTGSATFKWLGDPRIAVTFNGSTFSNIENNTITWTADSITFNGTTISNSDVNVVQ